MTVVLDASAALEIALANGNASVFLDFLKKADVIISPDTFISEVTNVFWKYRKFSQFSDESCLKGIEFCISLVDDFINSRELWREAYSEGMMNQSSTYDMFYLVAARRNSGKIISMDKKLNSIAERAGLRI